jgi:hypothetical protein
MSPAERCCPVRALWWAVLLRDFPRVDPLRELPTTARQIRPRHEAAGGGPRPRYPACP